MPDWDIEPRENYKQELVFRAVKVPGIGRFHSRREAAHRAGALRYEHRTRERRISNTILAAMKQRDTFKPGWWKSAAEEYNRRHGHAATQQAKCGRR